MTMLEICNVKSSKRQDGYMAAGYGTKLIIITLTDTFVFLLDGKDFVIFLMLLRAAFLCFELIAFPRTIYKK
jgi:hypothetical protein